MLRLGEEISAKLVEEIDTKHWIVSFDGSLLQVINSTPLIFEKNKVIQLRVEERYPLKLRVLGFRKTSNINFEVVA